MAKVGLEPQKIASNASTLPQCYCVSQYDEGLIFYKYTLQTIDHKEKVTNLSIFEAYF